MATVIKQNFNNPIRDEVNHLEDLLSLYKSEIDVRLKLIASYLTEGKSEVSGFDVVFCDQDWEKLSHSDKLEVIQHKTKIAFLKKEILAKESWLSELKVKLLMDEAETDENYIEASNNAEDLLGKVGQIEDPHEKLKVAYEAEELKLFLQEKNKEAVAFFYKALKQSLENAGVKV